MTPASVLLEGRHTEEEHWCERPSYSCPACLACLALTEESEGTAVRAKPEADEDGLAAEHADVRAAVSAICQPFEERAGATYIQCMAYHPAIRSPKAMVNDAILDATMSTARERAQAETYILRTGVSCVIC